MWIKICGIRDVKTAISVAAVQPDAIGLNFYAKSKRFVSKEIAAEIVEQLPDNIDPVALFVNADVQRIVDVCSECRIETVQLHGDESPQMLADLLSTRPQTKIIRAFRIGGSGTTEMAEYLVECRKLDVQLAACLTDAHSDSAYGGTGEVIGWSDLQADYQFDKWPPLILAGGLTMNNVDEAIQLVHPWGVDVASGVESTAGEKDILLVKKFIDTARIE